MQTYSSLSNCKNRTSNSGAELGMDLRSSRHSEADPGAAVPSPVATDRGFGQMVSGHKGAAPGTCSSGPMAPRTWPLGGYKEGPTVSWVTSFPSVGHTLTPNPEAYGQLTLRAQDAHAAWHSHPICTDTSQGADPSPSVLSSAKQTSAYNYGFKKKGSGAPAGFIAHSPTSEPWDFGQVAGFPSVCFLM